MDFTAPKITSWRLPAAADAGPSMGYADNFDRKTVTKNPAFLNDLRGRYGNLADEELLDKFYSDENWAQLNTLGAAQRYYEGGGTSTDEKSRNARLSKVWDGLPFFYQEGGRGLGAAGDIATSVLLDPINLIGGFAAKGISQGAMRTAVAAGKAAPVSSTLKGAGAAAASEGAISAGQEAIINASEQAYKQDIGLQKGFDQAAFNRAVGLGAVLGAGVGGVIGTATGAYGTRVGRIEGEADLQKAAADKAALDALQPTVDQTQTLADQAVASVQPTVAPAAAPVAPVTTGGEAAAAPTVKKFEETKTVNAETGTETKVVTETEGPDTAATEAAAAATPAKPKAKLSKAQKTHLTSQLEGTGVTVDEAMAMVDSGEIPVTLGTDGSVSKPKNAEGKKTSQLPYIKKAAVGKKKDDTKAAAAPVATKTQEQLRKDVQDLGYSGVAARDAVAARKVDAPDAEADARLDAEVEVPAAPARSYTKNSKEGTAETPYIVASVRQRADFNQAVADAITPNEKGTINKAMYEAELAKSKQAAPPEATPATPATPAPATPAPTSQASELAAIVAARANGDESVFARFAKTPEEATSEKPFINFLSGGKKLAKATELMTDNGLTIDDITPNELFVIDLKQINKAAQNTKGTVSPAAMQNEDLLIKYLDQMGDDVPQDNVRAELALELEGADVEDPDAILAMYDAFTAKNKSEQTELDELTQLAERSLKDFKPNASQTKRIRDYAKKLMEPEDGKTSGFDSDTANRLAKLAIAKDHYDQLDLPAEQIPTVSIGGQKVPIRDVMSKVRLDPQAYAAQQRRMGTASAIEGASELVGAGRNENGRVIAMLRGGARLNKADQSRTEHKTLLERGEDFFMGESYLEEGQAIQRSTDNMAANARKTTLAEHLVRTKMAPNPAAAKKMIGAKDAKPTVAGIKATASTEVGVGDIVFVGGKPVPAREELPTIIGFEATGSTVVNRLSGKPSTVKKGTVVFADGKTQRTYDSPQTVLIKRDPSLLKKDSRPAVTETKDSSVDGQVMDDLSRPDRGLAPIGVPLANAQTLLDPANGTRLAIIKHKEDPSDIRIMHPRQAANNVTLESLAGKAGIENFEVKYVQSRHRLSDTMTVDAKTRLFNEIAEDFVPVDGVEFQPLGGVFMSGNATGRGFPMSSEGLGKILINKSDLTEQEILALDRFSTKPVKDMKSLSASQIVNYISKAENSPIPKTENEMAVLISDLEQMHMVLRREIPEGYVKPAGVRDEVAAEIQTIFNKVSPEEGVAAARMIEGLGGDMSKAPAFDEPSGTFQYNPKTNKIEGTDQLVTADKGERTPMLLRETASWAYDNIMTPEDRLEFWGALKRQIASGDTTLLAAMKDYKPNQSGAARRIFADNFTSWALENRSAGHFKDKSFWQKLQRTIKGVFDRYFSKKAIDPELEPIFAKVLPDGEMHYRKFDDFTNPSTKAGVTYSKYAFYLQDAEKEIKDAILAYGPKRDGSDTRVVDAFKNLQSTYAGIVANVGPRSDKAVYGSKPYFKDKTLMPFKRFRDIYSQRLADMNEIMYGKTFVDGDRLDAETYSTFIEQEGLNVEGDKTDVANTLIDAYYEGHKNFTPKVKPPTKIVNEDFTSLEYSIRLAKNVLKAEYTKAESGSQMAGLFTEVVRKKSKKNKLVETQIVKHSNAKKRQADAIKNALTGKEKGLKKKVSAGDDPYTSKLRVMDQRQLEEEFRANPTDKSRQEQISWMMYERDNNAYEGHVRGANVAPLDIPQEISRLSANEKQALLFEAIDGGDSDTIDMLLYYNTTTMQRRKFKNNNPNAKAPKHLEIRYVRERIKSEVDHGAGTYTSAGIPPSAPFNVRNILSYLTHRDPKVNYTQRTMTYRMINLMGKGTRDVLDDTNIMDASDVARLAGVDPMGMKNVAMDFRGDQFKKLRSDSRRLAIGLTKGNTNPFDVIHEITHTVVRAGMLPKQEMDAVVELYRSADDGLKTRINKDYGGKYPDASEAQKELILAEEWFAENLTKFMGERVARGDILKALNGGDMASLTLKNSFHSAIDRAIEYVAYIVNGLIGRKTVKQNFRRLMFYGNMFEQPSKAPFASLGRRNRAVSPTYAGQYANDVLRQSTGTRLARIKKYTGGGKFSENEDGPITYFHATPNGSAFNRQTNPDVVMSPGGGAYGPGIYISPDAQTLDSVYARRPTIGAMTSMINKSKASDEVKEELREAAMELGEVRSLLSQKRRDYAEASDTLEDYNQQQGSMLGGIRMEDLDEESVSLINYEREQFARTKSDISEEIDDLLSTEEVINDLMDRYGIVPEPLVMPLYTRMMNTADFSSSTKHGLDEPFMQAIFRKLIDDGVYTQPDLEKRIVGMPQTGFNGDATYQMLTDLYAETGVSRQQAKAGVNGMLEDMGYDSLKTTHMNTLTEREAFGDMSEDGLRAGTQKVYDAFLLFNPEQAKHIEAKFFDEDDARMYFRDTGTSPAGFNGAVVTEMVEGNIDSLDPNKATEFLDDLEAKGTPTDLVDAMGSIMRERTLSPREEKAVRKLGPLGFLKSQSGRMETMGMNWLGGWYKQHFPDNSQAFASKFMPLHKAMKDLPDADGKFKTWRKRNAGLYGKEAAQPDSHSRIVKALRFGPTSTYFSRLSADEQMVANRIRKEFNDEHERMRAADMFVGFRRDYVPQIWKPETIRNNEAGFKMGMAEYYRQEKTSAGVVFTQDELKEFVDSMYDKLANLDAEDGVQGSSSRGSSTSPSASSLDYSRMIELEKYPRAMEALDGFLENNLEAMLIKSFEASTRRLLHVEKFGLNSHGVSDYIAASEGGSKGIAKLLSTNKEYVKNFRVVDGGEGVTEVDLKEGTLMPFATKPEAAPKFVDALIQVYNSPAGGPIARDMLMRAAVTTSSGAISKTYERRVDAIMGALEDFKGVATPMTNDEHGFLENAMRVARKQPINGGVANGKVALRTSRTLRSINNVSLLGFTTLTSLGDVVLPIIRSGSFSSWAKATKNLQDPAYATAMKNVGVAMENIVHDRMVHMYGGVDSKFSNAFFNATMLTPWTDTMRQLAGAVGHEAFKTYQVKTVQSYNPSATLEQQPRDYKIAYRQLKQFGLEKYAMGQSMGGVSLSDKSLLETDKSLRMGVLRFANESVFQPNADDIPIWAQTPLGALAFQLKSFPLMMGRMSGHILREAFPKSGQPRNIKPLLYFLSFGPAAGAGAAAIKDVVQMRGGEDERSADVRVRNAMKFAGYDEKVHGNEQDFLGWYLEGLMVMGGFGLIADVLHSAASQVDNGAYGQQRVWSSLLGPTYGLGNSAFTTLGGAKDAMFNSTPESNAKERSAVREVATRVPVLGGIRSLRESVTDAVAGEPSSSSGGRGGFSGSFNGSWG